VLHVKIGAEAGESHRRGDNCSKIALKTVAFRLPDSWVNIFNWQNKGRHRVLQRHSTFSSSFVGIDFPRSSRALGMMVRLVEQPLPIPKLKSPRLLPGLLNWINRVNES
jgi:hypothetical protein